jgi:hypothetical protein
MPGDERKRMLAMIFTEIRADHVEGKRLLGDVQAVAALGTLRRCRTGAKGGYRVGGRLCVNL